MKILLKLYVWKGRKVCCVFVVVYKKNVMSGFCELERTILTDHPSNGERKTQLSGFK